MILCVARADRPSPALWPALWLFEAISGVPLEEGARSTPTLPSPAASPRGRRRRASVAGDGSEDGLAVLDGDLEVDLAAVGLLLQCGDLIADALGDVIEGEPLGRFVELLL